MTTSDRNDHWASENCDWLSTDQDSVQAASCTYVSCISHMLVFIETFPYKEETIAASFVVCYLQSTLRCFR